MSGYYAMAGVSRGHTPCIFEITHFYVHLDGTPVTLVHLLSEDKQPQTPPYTLRSQYRGERGGLRLVVNIATGEHVLAHVSFLMPIDEVSVAAQQMRKQYAYDIVINKLNVMMMDLVSSDTV